MPAAALTIPEGWVKVTEDGHLIKKIEVAGSGEENPTSGSKVEVHYTGRLVSNGSKFDSSRDRGDPFSFKLGQGQVIKGWDEGVKTMKRGEQSVFRMASDYGYGDNGSGAKIPGGADLEFDIELLDWNSKEDITNGKKGIFKAIVKEGEGYQTPNDCAKVSIALTITYNGEVKESYTAANPLELTVGDEEVQRGIEKAVMSMKLNEKAKFDVAPEWGYGEEGNEKTGIPANAKIAYEIELLSMEREKESWNLNTPAEKMEFAKGKKEQGNKSFKAGKLSAACKRYEAGISAIKYAKEWEKEEQASANELLVVLNQNIATVKSKAKEWKEVIKYANAALEVNPSSVKALFRKGSALAANGDWEEAKKVLNQGLEVDAENKDLKRELVKLTKKMKAQDAKDKQMYKKMFGN